MRHYVRNWKHNKQIATSTDTIKREKNKYMIDSFLNSHISQEKLEKQWQIFQERGESKDVSVFRLARFAEACALVTTSRIIDERDKKIEELEMTLRTILARII